MGDPVVFLLGQDATPEQIRELRAQLGLDQPFIVQFWHFLVNAAQGEFGLSLRQGAKVSRLIAERFPATLELALVAAFLALIVGVPMGVYAALKRRHFHQSAVHDDLAAGRIAAHLPDRYLADSGVLGDAGLVPSFGRGQVVQMGWWSSGLMTAKGLAPHHFASHHAGHFPAHPDHASGAC